MSARPRDARDARTRAARSVLVCLVTAALAGCMVLGPDYKRPKLNLPTAWRDSLPDAADLANTAWWDAFQDPDLSGLIKNAIDANKDLLIATHRVEQLEAVLQVSQSALYPQFGYDGGRERRYRSQEQPALLNPGRPASYNNYQVDTNLNWEFDFWGRIARSNEAARAELLASQQARREVMLKVVTGVATAYVQLLTADRQLVLAQQTLSNRKDFYALMDQKYQGGSATLMAAVEARAAVEEAQAAIPPVELNIAQLENALNLFVGRNPGPIERRTLAQLKLPRVPAGIPSDVLDRRPDVVAAEQTLIAANARIGVAKAEYFPTISLTSALGLQSDQLQWLMAKTARTGDVNLGLVGTLFSGGRIEGDIKGAEAVQKQMAETYLQSIQTALREVDDALISRSKAGERVQLLGQRVQSLREVTQLVRQRYEGGESTYLDVLNAEHQAIAAEDQQTQGWQQEYSALVAVYKAMGGGWMVQQEAIRAGAVASSAALTPNQRRTAAANEIEIRQ